MIKEDLTGRDRIVRNVGASYLGQIVTMVFGFVLPRVINDQAGQVALGVWDFGWAFISYLSLSMVGIGSSVNRFVARHRAAEDVLALNRTVSTVVAIQIAIAIGVLILAIIIAFLVPYLFEGRLGTETETTSWIFGLLGASLAVEMAFDAWRGVLSGCHRWDYYNAINAGGSAVTSTAMIVVLYAGYGLVGMAWVYFCATVATEVLRYFVARRVCPEIELRRSYVNREDGWIVVKFGVKTIMLALPTIISSQTIKIFIVANLGPASLAVLSRPLALMRTVTVFVSKYTNVLTPTAGSLQSQGRFDELREFALQSSRNGLLLTIPALAYLFTLGDYVLEVWMGPEYANWTITAIMAAGFVLPISQGALLRILVGMDVHGGIAKISAVTTTIAVLVGLLMTLVTGWSITVSAVLIAVPVTLGIGLTVLIYGFSHLKLTFSEYFRAVILDGATLFVAICIGLFGLRTFSPYSPLVNLVAGMAITGLIVVALHAKDLRRVLQEIRK